MKRVSFVLILALLTVNIMACQSTPQKTTPPTKTKRVGIRG